MRSSRFVITLCELRLIFWWASISNESRAGLLRWRGPLKGLEGDWAGIELDQPRKSQQPSIISAMLKLTHECDESREK